MNTCRDGRDAVQQRLDDGVDAFDAATLSQLNRARQQALARSGRQAWWAYRLPVAGLAAAVLLGVWLLPLQPAPAEGEAQLVEWLVASPDETVVDDLALYLVIAGTPVP